MSLTKDKLSEAEFFFEQLKNSVFEYPQFNVLSVSCGAVKNSVHKPTRQPPHKRC